MLLLCLHVFDVQFVNFSLIDPAAVLFSMCQLYSISILYHSLFLLACSVKQKRAKKKSMSILYLLSVGVFCSVCISVTTLANLELSCFGVFVYLIGVVAQKCLFGKTQCFKHGIWVKSMRFMQAKQTTMQKSTLVALNYTHIHTQHL